MSRSSAVSHAGALALFAALAVAWTWPLAAHLTDSVPGGPGDNYSFLWDLWWVRTALDTPGLAYFRTTYLFYPFGVDMVGQPHVALPGLVAATLLRPLTLVAAHNVMVLAFVFANMACMYALAWDITGHRRASILAAAIFGLSPYLGVHLVGHFDLMAAFPLPLFALLLRRALAGSNLAAAGAGIVAAADAYTTYYYVFYLGLLAIVVLAVRLDVVSIGLARRAESGPLRRARLALIISMAAVVALTIWIAATGGKDATASIGISMTSVQNPLSALWILAFVRALCTWRITIARRSLNSVTARRALVVCIVLAVLFIAGALPLIIEAANVIAKGEYVSQTYFWRSAPHGVDAIAPFIGPPAHPMLGAAVRRLYASMHLDPVEAVGWLGILPPAILFATRHRGADRLGSRLWWAIGGVFGLLALGPLLTVAGFDTGLRLPAILLRYVPFAANARMPGRMMVVVFMALAALIAVRIAHARGRLASPALQWLLVALVAFEYWDAPIPITPLDRPQVYQTLAQLPPGGVCEAPFGIGDGLSGGVGSQQRRVLYYATIHRHPLAGGFVGRMPVDAQQRYERMAVAGDLLRLSSGRVVDPRPPAESSPCDYLVVRDRELSPALRAYVQQLPREAIASDDNRELFRLRDPIRPR